MRSAGRRGGALFVAAVLGVGVGCGGISTAPVNAPPGTPATASFVSSGDEQYQVAVQTPVGPQACVTPCTLGTASGLASVSVSGPRTFMQPTYLPGGASQFRIRHQRTGLFLGGLALFAVGDAAILVGGAMAPLGLGLIPLVSLLTIGVVLASAGIIMLAAGVRIVVAWVPNPGYALRRRRAPATSGLALTSVGLAPTSTGGAEFGLSFRF
jgi:hypothetical protein